MSKGNGGVSGYTHTQSQLDDYANQCNPNNDAYQANWDNHADQCNPNNEEYAGSDDDRKQGNLEKTERLSLERRSVFFQPEYFISKKNKKIFRKTLDTIVQVEV